MDSGSLKSQLASLDRQIGDKEQQIQIDNDAAQREQQNMNVDINDAQQHLMQPETEPGQHQSWQTRLTRLQSQLQQEMQRIQTTQQTHQSDLSTLQKQRQNLLQEIQQAEQREQAERIARMAA